MSSARDPPRRILVTGGAGFLGRWVVRELLRRGCRVLVLDDLSAGMREALAEFKGHRNFLGLRRSDVRNRSSVAGALRTAGDACVHLAARVNVQDSIGNPGTTFAVNVAGTLNLLEEARLRNTRIVLAGSGLVYGASRGAVSEDCPVSPASPFAASKLAAEALVLGHGKAYGLPAVVLRIFNIYGPWQQGGAGNVVASFLSRKLRGMPLHIYGDGRQTRDLLYVEDCARAVAAAALRPRAIGRVLNIGSGRDVSIHDLALRVAGGAVPVEFVAHLHPRSEVSRLRCDNRRARRVLAWKPRVPLEQGLRKFESWMRESLS